MKKRKDGIIAKCLLFVGLTLTVFAFIAPTRQVAAGGAFASPLPTLEDFASRVFNGEADTLRGVYVPDVLALPVAQQPPENPGYVSPGASTLTEFAAASKAGNVGLLAHNYLAGRLFFMLQPADLIILVYGDARAEFFAVESVHRYEVFSGGVYKTEAGELLNGRELFNAMYGGERHVTLQTCIAKGDDLNWGRLFVVARKIQDREARILTSPETVPAPPPLPVAVQPTVVLGWPLTRVKLDPSPATAKP